MQLSYVCVLHRPRLSTIRTHHGGNRDWSRGIDSAYGPVGSVLVVLDCVSLHFVPVFGLSKAMLCVFRYEHKPREVEPDSVSAVLAEAMGGAGSVNAKLPPLAALRLLVDATGQCIDATPGVDAGLAPVDGAAAAAAAVVAAGAAAGADKKKKKK